jgi:hypothetical protein
MPHGHRSRNLGPKKFGAARVEDDKKFGKMAGECMRASTCRRNVGAVVALVMISARL